MNETRITNGLESFAEMYASFAAFQSAVQKAFKDSGIDKMIRQYEETTRRFREAMKPIEEATRQFREAMKPMIEANLALEQAFREIGLQTRQQMATWPSLTVRDFFQAPTTLVNEIQKAESKSLPTSKPVLETKEVEYIPAPDSEALTEVKEYEFDLHIGDEVVVFSTSRTEEMIREHLEDPTEKQWN